MEWWLRTLRYGIGHNLPAVSVLGYRGWPRYVKYCTFPIAVDPLNHDSCQHKGQAKPTDHNK